MLRSLDLTITHIRRPHATLTLSMINNLVHHSTALGSDGLILRTAILFSFFGLLHHSNLAPDTTKTFDAKRHTCRGDVLLQDPGLVIMFK